MNVARYGTGFAFAFAFVEVASTVAAIHATVFELVTPACRPS